MHRITSQTGQQGAWRFSRLVHDLAAWLTEHLDLRPFLENQERFAGTLRHPRWHSPAKHGKGARVLIIEDEAPIRDLVTDALEECGYSLEVAANVEEAERRIQEERPNLIILDLRLPGRSGWDFLRQRHDNARLSSIPVIVVSAAPEDRLLEAKELGADAFLSKPFDLDLLSAVVRGYAH